MPTFTLQEFEQTGQRDRSDLRLLGQREWNGATLSSGKLWLSTMLAEGRLTTDRFYRFEAPDCSTDVRREFLLNIAFYLFPDGRLCPVRIWNREAGTHRGPHRAEWLVDFEGVPGWSLIGSVEPRWKVLRSVPAERSWMGRSKRDWHLRDCWTPLEASTLR